MSALAASPGFTHPSLDYANAEFYLKTLPALNVAAPAQVIQTIDTAGNGYALQIQSVATLIQTSAGVANRLGQVSLFDGDNNTIGIYAQTILATASTAIRWNWLTSLSTAYSASTDGYSPLPIMILLPGFGFNFVVNSAQAGDLISQVVAVGVKIPVRDPYAATPPPPVAPALV